MTEGNAIQSRIWGGGCAFERVSQTKSCEAVRPALNPVECEIDTIVPPPSPSSSLPKNSISSAISAKDLMSDITSTYRAEDKRNSSLKIRNGPPHPTIGRSWSYGPSIWYGSILQGL